MKRLLAVVLTASAVALTAPAMTMAQTCVGTSGSATIGGTVWTSDCVVAITAPDCVDSTGATYECFEILGTDSTKDAYDLVALFLVAPPVQGGTYALGATSGNGAMVIGAGGFFVTADAPYVGSMHVSLYDPSAGTIECSFSYLARSLFGDTDLSVDNGTFSGRLVPVAPTSWSAMKQIYR